MEDASKDHRGSTADTAAVHEARRIERLALRALPQPLHLYEYATRSSHYHQGYFESPTDSLSVALDSLSSLNTEHFRRAGTILDVGCGLGGTVRVLDEQGFEVTGIDPCREAIAYARDRVPLRRGRFVRGGLHSMGREIRAQRFHGLVLNEVLQHFPSLEELFLGCEVVLRPGAVVIINEVAKVVNASWEKVPFHPRGALCAAAAVAGFEVVDHRDLTSRVLPTLPRLMAEFRERRGEILRFFGSGRPEIRSELDELLGHMGHLDAGYQNGELAYESTVLRHT